MNTLYESRISGIGAKAPEKILTNADLEKIVDTTDEWISTRTGIKERHIADKDTATSDIATGAALIAMERAGAKPEEIDGIIVATVTPDYVFPSTANIVQKNIGANNAFCFDIEAACSGLLYGITIARNFIATGSAKKILVIGGDTLSKITNWEDRNTCVLFGDGAGAVIIERAVDDSRILSTFLGGNGEFSDLLILPAGGSRNPATIETVQNKQHSIQMKGKEVFKAAVNAMKDSINKAMAIAGITPDDIKLVISHQANMRIIESLAEYLKMGMDRVYHNIERYGNTSAASIGLALNEALENNRIKKGDIVATVAFGGGFTWGSVIFRY